MAGIRLAVGRAVIGIVVAEFFTALSGLGGLIIVFSNSFATAKLFVPVITLVALGLLLTAARPCARGSVRHLEGDRACDLGPDSDGVATAEGSMKEAHDESVTSGGSRRPGSPWRSSSPPATRPRRRPPRPTAAPAGSRGRSPAAASVAPELAVAGRDDQGSLRPADLAAGDLDASGVYFALDNGFFEEEGLEVEVIPYPGSTTATRALLSLVLIKSPTTSSIPTSSAGRPDMVPPNTDIVLATVSTQD